MPVGGVVTEVTDGVNSGIVAMSLGCGTSLRREGPALEVVVIGCRPAAEAAAEVTAQPVQDGPRVTICCCCASLTVRNMFLSPVPYNPVQKGETNKGGERKEK